MTDDWETSFQISSQILMAFFIKTPSSQQRTLKNRYYDSIFNLSSRLRAGYFELTGKVGDQGRPILGNYSSQFKPEIGDGNAKKKVGSFATDRSDEWEGIRTHWVIPKIMQNSYDSFKLRDRDGKRGTQSWGIHIVLNWTNKNPRLFKIKPETFISLL